jgi:hypothetical protein
VLDKVTEAIAHFIGLFQTSIDELRLRKDYAEFQASGVKEATPPEIPAASVEIKSPHQFVAYDPGVKYLPVPPDLQWLTPWSHVDFQPPDIPTSVGPVSEYPGGLHMGLGSDHSTHITHMTFESGREILKLDAPHQLAVIDHQQNSLSDDDYVSIGHHGLKFSPDVNFEASMSPLLDAANDLTPLKDAEIPGSTAEISAFISKAPAALRDYASEHQQDQNVSVVDKPVIEGRFVNGEAAIESPKLKDHRPEKDAPQAKAAGPVHHMQGQGEIQNDGSVTLEAGGNSLTNVALLQSYWLTGHVTAVLGDYVEVNVITQVNIYSDHDSIGSSLNGWTLDADSVTEAFNIATFHRIDPAEGKQDAAPASGDFPKVWAVTEIKGDMIFLNWVEQYNFMTDNDIHIMSSTGVQSIVTTGENIEFNNMSLADFGSHYDLIVVGGNIYDGNFIQQTNVLLDNDLIGAVGNFSTSGNASISSGGNLLWNQAEITNIGASDRFETLPGQYNEAAANFNDGNWKLPESILNDSAFAGIDGLRILYVGGSIYDLQYIKQINVLGDSDQVALAMSTLGSEHPDADWDITTGSNALVNVAEIVDADSTGPTYVGNEHYSDEILIQAELVSPNDSLGGQDPDVLVNEAVAFLGDDTANPVGTDTTDPGADHHLVDAPQADVMQHMLG